MESAAASVEGGSKFGQPPYIGEFAIVWRRRQPFTILMAGKVLGVNVASIVFLESAQSEITLSWQLIPYV
jgi:hypothetical protein